jgi:hypothetical protein
MVRFRRYSFCVSVHMCNIFPPLSFRFCKLKGHEMFCEVERSYIEDGFNLYGLRACVSNFSDCLDLILDRIGPDDSYDGHLTQSACTLYGLIHARYVITARGLEAMYNKVSRLLFAGCYLKSRTLGVWSSCSLYLSLSLVRTTVRGKGLWFLRVDTMFRSTCATRWTQGRNGRGRGQKLLSQMPSSVSSTSRKEPSFQLDGCRRSRLWEDLSASVFNDL